MLTLEQQKTLENACTLYLKARGEKEDRVAALTLYNEAFGMLADYIDEVDDIYYRIVFANCIEELQRRGNIDFGVEIIQAKVRFYIDLLNWFLDAPEYKTEFQGHLHIAFDALARLCLLGEDNVKQNDHYAYICYQCIKLLGVPMADELYLQDFIQDDATGQWKFIGVRPQ